MGRWIEIHRPVSDVQIKISLLVFGFIATAALLMFYSYSISR
jgi:hypothetical protein